jgi:hypothetical protein
LGKAGQGMREALGAGFHEERMGWGEGEGGLSVADWALTGGLKHRTSRAVWDLMRPLMTP